MKLAILVSLLGYAATAASHSNGLSSEAGTNYSLIRRLQSDKCNETEWPDKDHNLVCSDCKVLVHNFKSTYGSCEEYCATVGRQCTGAWEEVDDDCNVKYTMTCTQSINSSDAICECGAEANSSSAPCGVNTCTPTVLDTDAGGHTCSDRINWLMDVSGLTDLEACARVAVDEFPNECGGCDPSQSAPVPNPVPAPPTPGPPGGECDEASWPDKDHDLVCGECKVLVNNFAKTYGTCHGYCSRLNRVCTGAWDEQSDTCTQTTVLGCFDTLGSSDAICECATPCPPSGCPTAPTFPPSPTPPPVDPAKTLKVMSFNLYGWNAFKDSGRSKSMMNLINGQNPDVYGAQELERRTSYVKTQTGLRSIFTWDQHGLNIFYNSNTVQLEHKGTFDLVEMDQWGQRIVMWGRFKHIASEERFYYFSSHWCVCGESELFKTAQTSAREIKRINSEGLPVVFGGDLNVFGGTDKSKAIRYLTGETVDGLTTLVKFADTYKFGGMNGGPGTHGSARIDYLLATDKFNVLDGTVLPKESGSDHNGITTTLAFA